MPLALAVPAALALFLAMSLMIAAPQLDEPSEPIAVIGVDLIAPPTIVTPSRPPPPQPPEAPARSLIAASLEVSEPWSPPPRATYRPDPNGWLASGLGDRNFGDHEPMPLLQPTPMYPIQARRDGVIGWVRVSFVVSPDGGTRDVRVLDASPEGYFEAHAVASVMRWRFRPAVVDGEVVAQRIERIIDYNLADGW